MTQREPDQSETDQAASTTRDVSDVTRTETQLRPGASTTVDGRTIVPAPPAAGQLTPGRATVYSDLHCRLLVDEGDKVTHTVTEQVGAGGELVHRQPEQVVTDPVECPTCGVVLERYMLALSPITGARDCPIAVQARGNPTYTRLFGAMAGNVADATAEAAKHGAFGARVLAVLGPQAEAPAFSGPPDARPPAELVRGENLTEEAKAEHDRLDAQRAQPQGWQDAQVGEGPNAANQSSAATTLRGMTGSASQQPEAVPSNAAAPRAEAAAAGDPNPTATPGADRLAAMADGHEAAVNQQFRKVGQEMGWTTDPNGPPGGAAVLPDDMNQRDELTYRQTQATLADLDASLPEGSLVDRQAQLVARLADEKDPEVRQRIADELRAIDEHRAEQGT